MRAPPEEGGPYFLPALQHMTLPVIEVYGIMRNLYIQNQAKKFLVGDARVGRDGFRFRPPRCSFKANGICGDKIGIAGGACARQRIASA